MRDKNLENYFNAHPQQDLEDLHENDPVLDSQNEAQIFIKQRTSKKQMFSPRGKSDLKKLYTTWFAFNKDPLVSAVD
jgi:hypothetical protein